MSGEANCTIAINVNIAPQSDPLTPAAAIAGWHPADLQSAYAIPSSLQGGTVAIVDAYDNPSAEADLAVYRSAFGLPACTSQNGCFRKLNQQGQAANYPAVNAGWGEEIDLDLQMVSAACPNCSIVLVEANSDLIDDLGAAADTAANLGARAISNSYYAAEWANETSEDAHYRHPGIAVVASSGDRGYPSYPASSANVTSVGGTSLSRANGAWNESFWQYGGGGCSRYVARPPWQPHACQTRTAVDVAMVADPQTGVAMFDAAAGGWLVAGGTSVGAPLVAAMYALAGNAQGPWQPYVHANAFADVGPAGFDMQTGLGAPRGISGF